jgi:signal peptide peptidase SppA
MAVSRVRAWFRHQPFAMLPEAYDALVAIVDRHDAGVRLSIEEIRAQVGGDTRPDEAVVSGGVAIVPIYGAIVPRSTMFSDVSGLASSQRLAATIRDASEDPSIKAILLDIDSPGGSAFGLAEVAAEMFAARERKPMVAISRYMTASAAYMLASQAHEVVASPSSMLGSIGVFMEHWDETGLNEKMGVKPTYIYAGKHKTDVMPGQPLNDDAIVGLQHMVDGYYSQFVSAVARGRGVTTAAVRSGYGEGAVLMAEDAVREGLADRVDTFENVLRRLQTPQGRGAATRAATDLRLRTELSLLEL